jgi:hypothetical protein
MGDSMKQLLRFRKCKTGILPVHTGGQDARITINEDVILSSFLNPHSCEVL